MGVEADSILFLSDTPEELVAAEKAGMKICQLVRPGTKPDVDLPQVADFEALEHLLTTP